MRGAFQYPPAAWSDDQREAFDALVQAVEKYALFHLAIQQLGVNDATILQRRDQLAAHIRNVLLPRFRDA